MLHYQKLLFVPKIIQIEFISSNLNNFLVGHFGVNKIRVLIGSKCYWLNLKKDVETCVKGFDVCLSSKTVSNKSFNNLKLLLILTYQWNDLSKDFKTRLPVLTNCKGEIYDSILVIVNRLTKMIYYKLVKVTFNALELAKVIFNVVIWYYSLFD